MRLSRLAVLAILAAAAPALATHIRPALAGERAVIVQERGSGSWTEEKCVRYRRAWSEFLARRGRQGLGSGFVEAHEAFLASGCTARADVCPRSPEELDAANMLTIAAMNAGMSATFLPFACRKS